MKTAQTSCLFCSFTNWTARVRGKISAYVYIWENCGMLFNYHIVIFPVVRSICRDAKCGKIQCQGGANRPVIGTNAVSIETNIPLQEGGRILCRGTHVYLGDDMPDPGLVLTGTKCGDGLVRAEIIDCQMHIIWIYLKVSLFLHIKYQRGSSF